MSAIVMNRVGEVITLDIEAFVDQVGRNGIVSPCACYAKERRVTGSERRDVGIPCRIKIISGQVDVEVGGRNEVFEDLQSTIADGPTDWQHILHHPVDLLALHPTTFKDGTVGSGIGIHDSIDNIEAGVPNCPLHHCY